MKFPAIAILAPAAVLLAGCAVDPVTVYGPGPVSSGTSAPAASAEGLIAQCGHAGAERAAVVYPEGWQARLNETAKTSTSNDELLGGPVTTEVVDRNAQPSVRPVPTYPTAAASAGREAVCYAMMDVNKSGMPEEILTACSSPEFNAATFNAIQAVRFSPKVVDGRNVRRLNVVYPIEYCLDY